MDAGLSTAVDRGDDITVTSCTVTGLANGSAYHVVVARGVTAESPPGTAPHTTVPSEEPGPVTGVAVTPRYRALVPDARRRPVDGEDVTGGESGGHGPRRRTRPAADLQYTNMRLDRKSVHDRRKTCRQSCGHPCRR